MLHKASKPPTKSSRHTLQATVTTKLARVDMLCSCVLNITANCTCSTLAPQGCYSIQAGVCGAGFSLVSSVLPTTCCWSPPGQALHSRPGLLLQLGAEMARDPASHACTIFCAVFPACGVATSESTSLANGFVDCHVAQIIFGAASGTFAASPNSLYRTCSAPPHTGPGDTMFAAAAACLSFMCVQVAAWKAHSQDYTEQWVTGQHDYIIKSAEASGLICIISCRLSSFLHGLD